MNIGELHIDKLYIGSLQVDKAYLGETLVYGDEPSTDYKVCVADINGAWFDTGIPNRLDIKSEITYKFRDDVAYNTTLAIFGARADGGNTSCNFFFKEGNATFHKYVYYVGNYYAIKTRVNVNDWRKITTLFGSANDAYTLAYGNTLVQTSPTYNGEYTGNVNLTVSGKAFDNTVPGTLYLCRIYGIGQKFDGLMYEAKFFSGTMTDESTYTTPIKDFCFVECPDKKVRLYDRIGKQLYENQSDTGTISVAEYTGEIIPIE